MQAASAGRRIRFYREEAGIKQRALAARAGISPSQLSKFEHGELPEMSVGRFFDLCAALGVDPAEIWWGKEPRQPIAAQLKTGAKKRRS